MDLPVFYLVITLFIGGWILIWKSCPGCYNGDPIDGQTTDIPIEK